MPFSFWQREKLTQESETSKKKTVAEINDDDSDSDCSSEEDSARMLSYRTPMLSQASFRVFYVDIFNIHNEPCT